MATTPTVTCPIRSHTIAAIISTLLLLATAAIAQHLCQTAHPGEAEKARSAAAGLTTECDVRRVTEVPDQMRLIEESASPSRSRGIARASRSLVDINVVTASGEGKAGTGIVLTASGRVLTNYHVISGAATVSVFNHGNGRHYTARVIGGDRRHDIAVIQLRHAHGLAAARLGDQGTVERGDPVTSIGNACGRGVLVYGTGHITDLHRSLTTVTETMDEPPTDDLTEVTTSQGHGPAELIEAQITILPGESGGAMINSHGQVIGVNVAYGVNPGDQSPNGSGFAIPIDVALHVAHDLVTTD